MPTAERRKQPRPVSTEDDLARFHASVAGGNHFPTTTRRPRTRANTGSDLAHARETTREKRRTERPRGAQSAETKGVALARRICEVPPRLAYRADVKKPETSSGFWNWWPVAESNHGHADFQSKTLAFFLLASTKKGNDFLCFPCSPPASTEPVTELF